MRHVLLATVSILSMAAASSAFAAMAEDAAYSKTDRPIYDSQGNCVRTQWNGVTDPCAPAAAPAPAPRPVVVQPAPAIPQVSLEQRTVYFDFNSAKLTGEGMAKLDQLATVINQSTAISEVSIHGYTDQIGSNSYNDALAQKRAHAVKGYLDSKARLKSIEGDIRGLGKAESDGHCKLIKKRTAQIACMSTQRRVEVEFKAQQ